MKPYTIHLVSRFELLDIIADCFHSASEVRADLSLLRPTHSHTRSKQGQDESQSERHPIHVIPVCCVYRGCVDLYQDSTSIVGSRLLYLLQLKNVRRPESFAYNRFHLSRPNLFWFNDHFWFLNH